MNAVGPTFDAPFGFFKASSATGGGGGTTIGSASIKYNSVTDPKGPEWTQAAALNRITMDMDTSFTQAAEIGLFKVFADTSFTQAANLNVFKMFMDSDFNQDVSRLQITTTERLATKDSYVDVTVGCVGGGTNHDGADLQCEGIVATRKDPIFGWDMSNYDANATVLSATVYLEQKTSPSVTGTNTLNTISSGNEGWTEGGVVCNNIPATVASAGTFSNSGTGAKSVSLNSTGLAALEAAMGTGSFSLRMTTGATVTNHSFESADEGTNDANGPRIDIVFTVPT